MLAGLKIKDMRELKNMKQNEVVEKATELGGSFSQSQYSNWENSKVTPSQKNIEILAKVFGVNIDELIDEGEYHYSIMYDEGYKVGLHFDNHSIKDTIWKLTAEVKNNTKIINAVMQAYLQAEETIGSETVKMLSSYNDSNEHNWDEEGLSSFVMGLNNGAVANKRKK